MAKHIQNKLEQQSANLKKASGTVLASRKGLLLGTRENLTQKKQKGNYPRKPNFNGKKVALVVSRYSEVVRNISVGSVGFLVRSSERKGGSKKLVVLARKVVKFAEMLGGYILTMTIKQEDLEDGYARIAISHSAMPGTARHGCQNLLTT